MSTHGPLLPAEAAPAHSAATRNGPALREICAVLSEAKRTYRSLRCHESARGSGWCPRPWRRCEEACPEVVGEEARRVHRRTARGPGEQQGGEQVGKLEVDVGGEGLRVEDVVGDTWTWSKPWKGRSMVSQDSSGRGGGE